MSKAHANSVLALKGVSVPLDNNTYAHWSFEQNLVSGINPIIPTVKYQNVYTNPNTKSDVMTTGKFGNGMTIDEATTNMISSTKLQYVGWTQYSGAVATITQGQIVPEWNTTTATRIQTTGGTGTLKYYISLGTSVNGTVYTASGYVKNLGTTSVSVRTQLGNTEIIEPGTSKFIVCTGTGNGTSGLQYRFQTAAAGDNMDIIAYQPQVEEKGYYTFFVNGQRYQTNIKYPLGDIAKTINFWFKSNSNKNLETIPRILMSQTDAAGELSTNPFWYCAIPSTGDVLMPTDGAPGLRLYNGTNYACQSTTNVLDGKWHFIVIELNVPVSGGYISRIWVDGFKSETTTYTNPILATDNNLKIGYMGDENTTTEFSNCTYDEISIRTAHYIEDEIISWYLSNMPFYSPYDYTHTV